MKCFGGYSRKTKQYKVHQKDQRFRKGNMGENKNDDDRNLKTQGVSIFSHTFHTFENPVMISFFQLEFECALPQVPKQTISFWFQNKSKSSIVFDCLEHLSKKVSF